ncbi:SusC/RagA family TonB-linked outer membrane protein [Gelidibacter gilvus]|uniref:SusC/RagA family TonB-linked outer membrane protein n=2 Tax=Gelidibacter maritimus TaxID=2761487 RepID=A0A7W2M4R2_9FLAO|nr:SusC/RagA family TonB-linked outer membrane protein [Gelidibacter maritimus]
MFTLSLTAQDILVTGKVTDGNLPISGANVLIKNTNSGVVTDFDGRYSITAKATDTLQISYLGYTTVTIPIQSRPTINITLQEDATALGEVQINAGYYTTTDREKTGSIARITAKEIEKQPVSNPLAAMQGRMAGVDIVETSGVPGSGFEVKIRGQNSIMAGNEPLYVLDGVPYDAQSLGSRNSSGLIIPGGNISPLNAINPSTIESIEVLKDADATAIYGSRGANGVVLITTKRGKKGKTSLNISSSTGIANITKKRDLLNSKQYIALRQEAFAAEGITNYPANAYDINGTWNQNHYTDWQKVLIGGTAKTRQVKASVSGGTESTQFLLSGMFQNETTVFPGDFNYDRITVNSNINHSSNDKRFQVALSTGYTIENNLLPGTDLTSNAYKLAPNAPDLYDDEGNLNWENSTWTNPLAELEGKYTNITNTLMANSVLNYKAFKNFEIKLNMGYNNAILEDNRKIPHTIYNPAVGLNSSVSRSYNHSGKRKSWILEPQLHWTRKSENHTWTLLFGTTFQSQKSEAFAIQGTGFANNKFIENLSAASTLRILNENNQEYNYQSVFARVNYHFKSKLFLNATGRRDGSSRFSSSNRYGNFGALGTAYIFSEDLNLSWLSIGKLRTSYGITGNDQIGDYQYLQTYSISDFPYDGNIGLQPTRLFNPHYKWEENIKKEIAIELGLFNQRISLSATYYNNRSSNQLLNYALPGTSGFTSIQANLDALVENSGWELELDGSIVSIPNFTWNTAFNLSLSKNTLLEFPGLEESSYANRFVIGKPLSIMKLYNLKGVNIETGLFEFTDYNGDGLITVAEDRQYLADLTPQVFGGISNSLHYKNWTLDVFFQFVKKQGINEFFGTSATGTMSNQPISVANHWQQSGDQSTRQQLTTGANPTALLAYSQFTLSNGIISDASFIRLKSLAISYTLPFSNHTRSSCRLSIQGQNLLTFTSFKGGDPEQGIGFLPPLRRITLGAQINL